MKPTRATCLWGISLNSLLWGNAACIENLQRVSLVRSPTILNSPAPNCSGAVAICCDWGFRQPRLTLRNVWNPLACESFTTRVFVWRWIS
ncbi:hypothetical protein EDB19DRAFT_621192 [Suillus lakei]|nr:hypothetical protein EDB19DRAFT_621192 [Suillus lakei]